MGHSEDVHQIAGVEHPAVAEYNVLEVDLGHVRAAALQSVPTGGVHPLPTGSAHGERVHVHHGRHDAGRIIGRGGEHDLAAVYATWLFRDGSGQACCTG